MREINIYVKKENFDKDSLLTFVVLYPPGNVERVKDHPFSTYAKLPKNCHFYPLIRKRTYACVSELRK